MKPVLLLMSLSTLALGGCMEKPSLGSYAADASATYSTDRLAATALPAASVSGAGRLISVRHGGSGDHAVDTYVFEGTEAVAGENRLEVSTGSDAGTANRAGSYGRVTQSDIDGELQDSFPGVAMQIASGSLSSPAGQLGYATGGKNGTQCLYAWQSTAPERPGLLPSLAGATPQPIRVRLRLCGTVTQAHLQSIAASLSWTGGGVLGPLADRLEPVDSRSAFADEGSLNRVERDRPAPAAEPARRHRAARRLAHGTPHRVQVRSATIGSTLPRGDATAEGGLTVPLPDEVAPASPRAPSGGSAGRPIGTAGQVGDLPMPKS